MNSEAKLPPGEYFVMPGSCAILGQAARMVSLARSGRLGEIVAAEVPKFVVPSEGQAKPMVIDGPAAESKMLAIP